MPLHGGHGADVLLDPWRPECEQDEGERREMNRAADD